MTSDEYNAIAKFYDTVIGDYNRPVDYVKRKIKNYKPESKSILELGCGTGNNLVSLKNDYEITGVDISQKMLSIAKKKIPNGKFYLKDIRKFYFNKKFDVIICLYDTINHLGLFAEWKKIFESVYKQLKENGLFIFDINTLYKLLLISKISPLIHKFDSSYLIIEVNKVFKNVYNWNLKVFENKKENHFHLFETNIKESSFDLIKIKKELSKLFVIKKIEDESEKKPKRNSGRIYFICQKI